MLFKRSATERVEENLEGRISADFVQRFALVLEDFLACHVFGLQDAAFGRAMHVLNQIALQVSRQQGILLFDKGAGGGIGQVLDGFAAQNRQLAST
ncbi:hypothetical protein D3C76_1411050 [compost metagenome]